MKVYPEQLTNALEPLRSVYLIAGPEILLREEAVDAVRLAAREQGVAQRDVLVAGQRFDWEQLSATGASMSLFAERKLLELRLPAGKPGAAGARAIGAWIDAGQDEGDVLLIVAEQWALANEKLAWCRKVQQAGVYVPVWNIKSAQLAGWIDRRMRARDLVPEREAVQYLAVRVDGSLLAAVQEIDKLLLANGPGKATLKQVEEAVSDSSEFDAFNLCAAIWSGKPALALRIAARLRHQGAVPQIIVATLHSELDTLARFQAMCKTSPAREVFQKLRIWPSRQPLVNKAADRLTDEHIQWGLRQVAALDRIAKGREPGHFWLKFEDLVLTLVSGPSRTATEV